MEEMEASRDFHGKNINGSLAFKHRERSLVYLDIVYCLMESQKSWLIKNKISMKSYAKNVDTIPSIENNETNESNIYADNVKTAWLVR